MAFLGTNRLSSITLFLGLAMAFGCGDAGSGGDPRDLCESDFVGSPSCFLPNFETEMLRPLLVGCAGDPEAGACHAAGTQQSTMVLDVTDNGTTVDAEIASLIGQNGLGGALVDTACIDQSFLLRKLTSNPGGGSRMPLGESAWSNDEIECFRAYLTDRFGDEPTE
ncbi:MAG: hypothetical protein AAF436_14900 [Myxococcota bacterium]